MSAEDPTRKQRRAEARAQRQALEAAAAARAARSRRLGRLGLVLAVAAGAVVALVLISSSGGEKKPASGSGAAPAASLFDGIPQHGVTLGRPSAPVTLVEFADLQCPICAEYDRSVLPELVQRYVRTGKVKMNLEVIAIIGPQSRDAGRAAAAAALQNRMWQFADAFYANQGPENGGYVTPQFIRSIAQKVPGLDVQRLVRDERSPAAEAIQREAVQLAARFGVDSTPTFELSRTGGKPTEVQLTQLSPDELAAAIDRLLAKR